MLPANLINLFLILGKFDGYTKLAFNRDNLQYVIFYQAQFQLASQASVELRLKKIKLGSLRPLSVN